MNLYTIETAGRANIPIQCVTEGGLLSGGFQSDDVITAQMRPSKSPTVVFSPSMGWHTASGTQNGYWQQQVEASITTENAAMLQSSVRYTLTVYRWPAADSSKIDIVAKLFFVAKGPSDSL